MKKETLTDFRFERHGPRKNRLTKAEMDIVETACQISISMYAQYLAKSLRPKTRKAVLKALKKVTVAKDKIRKLG